MSLPLRITFGDIDYTYKVLSKGINKETTQIKISLFSEEFTLIRDQRNEWVAEETSIGDNQALLRAIGRSLASRYRLK